MINEVTLFEYEGYYFGNRKDAEAYAISKKNYEMTISKAREKQETFFEVTEERITEAFKAMLHFEDKAITGRT